MGLIYKQERIGKGGKPFVIYKIRTMDENQEIKRQPIERDENDSRIMPGRKFLRKWGIDEFPQILNVLKGEMKIVGPRPLTKDAYEMLPDDLKKEREKQKPGFVPPQYAHAELDTHKIKGWVEAERRYWKERKKSPFRTDLKYLLKVVANFALGRAKSR